MTPEAFIHKHIVAALVADGVPDVIARGGGRRRRQALSQTRSGKPQGCSFRRLFAGSASVGSVQLFESRTQAEPEAATKVSDSARISLTTRGIDDL